MLADQILQLLDVMICCLGCRDKALDIINIGYQTALDCLFYLYL